MKSYIAIAFIGFFALCYAQQQYTNRYDNINLDEILSSKRLVQNYVTCLVNGRPCTPEGNELRKVLPDALKTKCAKCSERQKDSAYRVVTVLQRDFPQEWKQLLQKWDPQGTYFQSFQQELSKRNKAG